MSLEEELNAQIAQAIIALAHNLSISVIAEGVEERAQLTRLVSYGCDEMQGFLFSPPVPADEFAQMLAEERCLDLEGSRNRSRRSHSHCRIRRAGTCRPRRADRPDRRRPHRQPRPGHEPRRGADGRLREGEARVPGRVAARRSDTVGSGQPRSGVPASRPGWRGVDRGRRCRRPGRR